MSNKQSACDPPVLLDGCPVSNASFDDFLQVSFEDNLPFPIAYQCEMQHKIYISC